jgi:thioredoxin-dependent peroxiredoxin
MTIALGTPLPDGQLMASDGTPINLASLTGRPLVLYFYPKADTPGCTSEAKDFSALISDFDALSARVIGVSRDTPAKLAKFAAKYDLGVLLASDEAGAVSDAFGTWVEKSMYGRSYMGMERATFLFGADGRLAEAWHKVKVKGHAEAVLAAVRAL